MIQEDNDYLLKVFFLGILIHILIFLDEKKGSAENSKSDSASGESHSGQKRAGAAASGPGAGFPTNPFDFSAMTGLLNVLFCAFPEDSSHIFINFIALC